MNFVLIDRLTLTFRNIKRCLDWFPIIWRDRDYDYEFFIYLTRYKLERMRNYFQHDSVLVKDASEEIYSQINAVLTDLELYDEYYRKSELSLTDFRELEDAADQRLKNAYVSLGNNLRGWWD